MNFDDLYWHDSILKSITIDRPDPGYNDTVVLEIEWYTGEASRIKFVDVYKAKFDLNFGIIAQESILDAYCTTDDNELKELKRQWKGLLDHIDIKCFVITTNSTGGELKVLAKGSIRVSKLFRIREQSCWRQLQQQQNFKSFYV